MLLLRRLLILNCTVALPSAALILTTRHLICIFSITCLSFSTIPTRNRNMKTASKMEELLCDVSDLFVGKCF